MPGSPPLIEARDLTKRFGGIVAVSGLNLAVQQGELIGLIGPNGSGKTTTINMLTGHVTPAAATSLRGRSARGLAPSEFATLRVGRTFQITQLFSRMTVLENMLVPGLARPHSTLASGNRDSTPAPGIPRPGRIGKIAGEEPVGRANRSCWNSDVRLMLDPEILFLDEPFAGVNPFLRDEIIVLVQQAACRGPQVRHRRPRHRSMQRLVHRMVVMSRGEKIADGTVAEVRDEPGSAAGLRRCLTLHPC